MLSWPAVIALWAGLVFASLSGPRWAPPTEAALDAMVKRLRARPRAERVARVSARFLGTPFVLGPLGEGRGRDADPLWRWDAVDCVTFVEQVLALADARSLTEAEAQLQRIRYAHRIVRYGERNHLMEPAWLPNNIRKGFVRPITKQVAGADVRFLWRRERAADGIRDVALPYLPIAAALAHQREIPSATVFFVARRWGHPVSDHVSHVGLLIRKNGELYARHASAIHGRVVDEPFATFLRDERRSLRRWPVVGLELAEPSAPRGGDDALEMDLPE